MPLQRIARLVEPDVVRQRDGKVGVGHWYDAAVRTKDDRHRTAPVALARRAPVMKAILDAALAVRAQPVDHRLFGRGHVQSVEEPGIHERAVADIRLVGPRVLNAWRRFDDRRHVKLVGAGKVEVALVMRGTAKMAPVPYSIST